MVNTILQGLSSSQDSSMVEFEFDTKDAQESVMAFHTNEEGMIIVSIFDMDQWSLIQDMARFMNKDAEEIVRGLDPTGPNIYTVDPSRLQDPDEDIE